jgi:hypothetical protein
MGDPTVAAYRDSPRPPVRFQVAGAWSCHLSQQSHIATGMSHWRAACLQAVTDRSICGAVFRNAGIPRSIRVRMASAERRATASD